MPNLRREGCIKDTLSKWKPSPTESLAEQQQAASASPASHTAMDKDCAYTFLKLLVHPSPADQKWACQKQLAVTWAPSPPIISRTRSSHVAPQRLFAPWLYGSGELIGVNGDPTGMPHIDPQYFWAGYASTHQIIGGGEEWKNPLHFPFCSHITVYI